jgi:hypothetical protein
MPVPRKMTARAKANVGSKIAAAIARGAKRIDPEARHFADYGRARQLARRRAYARQQQRRYSDGQQATSGRVVDRPFATSLESSGAV